VVWGVAFSGVGRAGVERGGGCGEVGFGDVNWVQRVGGFWGEMVSGRFVAGGVCQWCEGQVGDGLVVC